MMMGVRWVVFDADNTLWDVEQLYDQARASMCEFLASRGQDLNDVEEFQQWRDKQLHGTYGYSACRFARSFEDTILHFEPDAPVATIRHVRQLAMNVFEQRAQVADGLDEVLDLLAAANYLLAIITAGERWVQERRLNDFHLRAKFAAVDIVEAKSEQVFRDFCRKRNANPSASWVIGDSLASDALPAHAAGMRAVLLRCKNWSHIEGEHANCPGEIPTIETLRELVDLPGILERKGLGD